MRQSRDRRGPKRSLLRPNNPYAYSFLALTEYVGNEMWSRNIRAWHYTRLTNSELKLLQRDGIHLSTPQALRARLDALVASEELSAQIADSLFDLSPLQRGQLEIRTNRFWMASHPVTIDDGGVEPLMSHWGGEVASMWITEPSLLDPLSAIGKPCVLEVNVPLSLTQHCYPAGEAVVATYARSLGCISDNRGFSLYVSAPLPPSAVERVHSVDDRNFHLLGRGYPERYVDVMVNFWKELSGEED